MLGLGGIGGAYVLAFGILYLCQGYFPERGLRDYMHSTAKLVDLTRYSDGDWAVSAAEETGDPIVYISPTVSELSVKVAVVYGDIDASACTAYAYVGEEKRYEAELEAYEGYSMYRFPYYETYIDRIEFSFDETPSGEFDLAVATLEIDL